MEDYKYVQTTFRKIKYLEYPAELKLIRSDGNEEIKKGTATILIKDHNRRYVFTPEIKKVI